MRGACQICNYETEITEYPFGVKANGQSKWLCAVCAKTPAGGIPDVEGRYTDGEKAILKTLAWGINFLADALRENTGQGGA